MSMKTGLVPVLGACLALVGHAAGAATVVNGSLESPANAFIETVPAGTTRNDWRVLDRNIEFVRNGLSFGVDTIASAKDGDWFVDLNGTQGPGGIAQDIATTVGQRYRVDFWMSGNAGPNGNSRFDGARTMNVLWNGTLAGSAAFTFQSGDRWSNLRWEAHSVFVTGVSGLDTLAFMSTSDFYSNAGPFVDAISITEVAPVPVPAALPLFGTALGFVLARNRRRPTA